MKSPVDLLIKELQGNLPLDPRPYRVLAERTGLSEQEVIDKIKEFKEQGKLRRVAAILRHQKAGYNDNAMVVWKAPEERCDQLGEVMATNPSVSHCYWRETPDDWPYTLYTMVHARSRDELQKIVNDLASAAGIDEYEIIESIKELKKTSVIFR